MKTNLYARRIAALGVAVCSMRLAVELTPDVPDPHDPGFLSSLLSDRVDYRLRWVRDSASGLVLDLTGPGPDASCRDVVRTMRNDGRVLSIHESAAIPQRL